MKGACPRKEVIPDALAACEEKKWGEVTLCESSWAGSSERSPQRPSPRGALQAATKSRMLCTPRVHSLSRKSGLPSEETVSFWALHSSRSAHRLTVHTLSCEHACSMHPSSSCHPRRHANQRRKKKNNQANKGQKHTSAENESLWNTASSENTSFQRSRGRSGLSKQHTSCQKIQ